MMMRSLDEPIRAAVETVAKFGVVSDRCEVLQNGSTLVLRLNETLVARVVQDVDGPRPGTEWFARENAIAQHLTESGAPIIPLHPDLPPGPHEHLGYPMNFWWFVKAVDAEPDAADVGRTLHQCHQALRTFPGELPALAILTESLEILRGRMMFPEPTQALLRDHLTASVEVLSHYPQQALHGDAHMGNLMVTTKGLRWTDWEDAFAGPVEWDLASILWNAKVLDGDEETVARLLGAYEAAGGQVDAVALDQCLIARAAVMSTWYPILYPNPDAGRRAKLQARLDWLAGKVQAD